MNVHAQRGQALIETAAFLPLLLLSMFAIIYFSRFGVLSERAQSAARYATMVSNAQSGGNIYSLEQMYQELHVEGDNTTFKPFPAGPKSCASAAPSVAIQQLTQSAPLLDGSTSAGATAPPYFMPMASGTDHTTCSADTISDGSNAPDVASSYFIFQHTAVKADVDVPFGIQQILGGNTFNAVDGEMSYIRPASPDAILYCSPNFAAALANAIGTVEPIAQQAFANYKVPPAGSPHVCT